MAYRAVLQSMVCLGSLKEKREGDDEEAPERSMQPSSSSAHDSAPSDMMVCKEIFACDHLFPTPTESESQLLEWLKSSSNDDDAEVKRTRYLVTEWDGFAADSHTKVRKKFSIEGKEIRHL